MPRVCSHMEPPPPEGNGTLYGLCGRCRQALHERRYNHPPRDKWGIYLNGRFCSFEEFTKEFPKYNSVSKMIDWALRVRDLNEVFLVSTTGVRIDPVILKIKEQLHVAAVV